MLAKAHVFALLCALSPFVAADTSFSVPGQWRNTLSANACPSTSSPQFFDISGLQCVACLNNTVARSDGLGCQCKAGSVLRALVSGPTASLSAGSRAYASCLSCAQFGLGTSADGSVCLECDAASGAAFSSAAQDCRCASPLSILTETDATGARLLRKRCVACPNTTLGHWQDTFPDKAGQRCQECPPITSASDPRVRVPMQASYNPVTGALTCTCNATADLNCLVSEEFQQTRLPSALGSDLPSSLSGAGSITFYGVTPAAATLPLQSATLGQLALSGAGRCLATGNREACNALANACVLQLYDSASIACRLYQGVVNNRNPNEVANAYHVDELRGAGVLWTDTMPWLFYRGSASDWLNRGDVGVKVSFYPQGPGSALTSDLSFVLSVYHMNGTWAGFRPLETQFQLCGTVVGSVGNQWRRFGSKFRNACRLGLAEMMQRAGVEGLDPDGNPYFFDLYLQPMNQGSGSAQWPHKLYPVPVLNRNLRSGGALVNADNNGGNDVLTRRFFLYDPVTAPTTESTGLPQAVRLAQSIAVSVRALPDGSGSIYPPLLTLDYMDRQPSFNYGGGGDVYAFSSDYGMDLASWHSAWQALLIVALVVAGLAWLARLTAISRKKQGNPLSGDDLLRGLLEGCDVFSSGLFILVAAVSIYWFIFFKLQKEVYTMLPTDADLKPFWRVSVAAVVMSSCGVMGRVYRQVNVDVFLLDWGKPRTVITEFARKGEGKVSCWRQLFVANEYNELQVERITNVDATYLFALFFLEGLRIRELTTVQPAPELYFDDVSLYQTPSLVLRFAMVCFFMLAPTLLQWGLKKMVIHHLDEHPLGMFVDLCYVANVSVFIFDDEYSGYYIHGECSDVNAGDAPLATINDLLRREAQSQLQERALPTAVSAGLKDCLCYEIYVPPSLRDKYRAKLLDFVQSQKVSGGAGGPGAAEADRRMEEEAKKVAEDFKKFINEDMKRVPIRPRDLVETLLHLPPDMATVPTNAQSGQKDPVVYADQRLSFGNNLFYGCEWQLVVFNTLTFATIDSSVQSFAVAAFISWVLNFAVTYARAELGERNLSRKSLVDRRFLI